MTQYMSFLLNPLVELFESYRDGKASSRELWATNISMLLKSIEYDDGGKIYSILPYISRLIWYQLSILA